jgi:BirA family biotin operon repressor/biotin-[acetyl-CoA-carboxylase] ligase
MAHWAPQLPPGCRYVFFDDIDTTNGEALRRASAGEQGDVWIWANRQSDGRGRIGRNWSSPPGNLYASILLRPRCPIDVAVGLSLVAGVAMHDAVRALTGKRVAEDRLRLKWPNDLLLDGLKLGGVLLESGKSGQRGECAVAIGTGINLANHPDDACRPATDLAAHGVNVSPSSAFAALAWATAERLSVWRNGKGFPAIRRAWVERAQGIGSEIAVRMGRELIRGVFLGVDDDGALLLSPKEGAKRRITAGDVFLTPGNNLS